MAPLLLALACDKLVPPPLAEPATAPTVAVPPAEHAPPMATPSSLFERAPVGVFLAGRLELAALPELVSSLDTELASQLPSLASCDVRLAAIERVEAVMASSGALVIDVHASFGIRELACFAGTQPDRSGVIRLGELELHSRADGVQVRYRSTERATAPVSPELLARIPATNGRSSIAAQLGEGTRGLTVELTFIQGATTVQLHFADSSRADAIVAWLERSRSRIDAERRRKLAPLLVERTASGVRLSFAVASTETITATLRTMAEFFAIPTDQMSPTLDARDQLLVDRLVRPGELARGDVVAYQLPANPEVRMVGRIVGLPGDRLRFVGGALELRGAHVEHRDATETPESLALVTELPAGAGLEQERIDARSYTIVRDRSAHELGKWITVPAGHFFAAADNRTSREDSRAFGAVPLTSLYGRAAFVWLSLHEGRVNQARTGLVVR
jgi:signal peptidase I